RTSDCDVTPQNGENRLTPITAGYNFSLMVILDEYTKSFRYDGEDYAVRVLLKPEGYRVAVFDVRGAILRDRIRADFEHDNLLRVLVDCAMDHFENQLRFAPRL